MGNIWSGIIPINYKLLYIKRTSRGRSSLRLVDATREIIRYLARARVLISVFRGVSTSGASKRKIWTFGTVLNRPFTFYTINSLCLGMTKETNRKKNQPISWNTLRICKCQRRRCLPWGSSGRDWAGDRYCHPYSIRRIPRFLSHRIDPIHQVGG